MKYIYTAKLTPIEDGSGYYASVPDLPGCVSSGHDLQDAITQISDALNLFLLSAEDDKDLIPSPTPHNSFPAEQGTIYTLVQADTDAYRKTIDTHSVRKNVSIPAWMDYQSKKHSLNLSQILQEALINRFNN